MLVLVVSSLVGREREQRVETEREDVLADLGFAFLFSREILRGSGGFFRPFGLRDKQGEALVEKCREGRVEEKLWEASERMVREKGVDV